jgi:hypothetical protein
MKEGQLNRRVGGDAPWLTAHAGTIMIWISMIHNVVGLLLFSKPLLSIVRAGVWNTVVPPHYDRGIAAWFLLSGVLMLMLGLLLRWSYQHTGSLPRWLGWWSLGFTLTGACLMPVSGFWLMIPVAIGMLQAPEAVPCNPVEADLACS